MAAPEKDRHTSEPRRLTGDLLFVYQPNDLVTAGTDGCRWVDENPLPQEESTALEILDEGRSSAPPNDPRLRIDKEIKSQSRFIVIQSFLENFILEPRRSLHYDNWGAILQRTLPNSPSTEPLYLCFATLAFHCLGNYKGSEHLKKEAFATYSEALRAIRSAINDPRKVKRDETLLAVMVLKSYELTLGNKHHIKSRRDHHDGATMLLKCRGEEQFDNPTSLKLFRIQRDDIVRTRILDCKPLEIYDEDSFLVSDKDIAFDPGDELSLFAARLPSLRSQAVELLKLDTLLINAKQGHNILREAQSIDKTLVKWFHNRPASLRHSSYPYLEPADIDAYAWPGEIHIYEDFYGAFTMNFYRSLRILTNGIISSCAAWLSSEASDHDYVKAIYVMQTMVDDICASIPYHLNYVSPFDPIEHANLTRAQHAAQACGAIYLIRPLMVALQVKMPELQRQWLLNRLRIMGNDYNQKRAFDMIKRFEVSPESESLLNEVTLY